MTTEPTDRSEGGNEDGLGDALVQVAFLTMAVLTKIGAEHDLSLTQLRVLGILRDRRPKMTVLADFLGLDKSTMTGLVDRATQRGLLDRSRDPADGRSVVVFLTEAGVRLADDVHTEVMRSLATSTAQLGPADRDRLRALLERLLRR
ncbi:MAG: MarR family transcriptional regulator [Propionibacteriaceae bacterium]